MNKNTFAPYNETAPAKCRARELRLALAKQFAFSTSKDFAVYSLPGFNGLFEKNLFRAINGLKNFKSWHAFENRKKIFDRPVNPFTHGRMRYETVALEYAGDDIPMNSSKNCYYINTNIELWNAHSTDLKDKGDKDIVLFDGDFCGYLSQEIESRCIEGLPAGSLLMLTLFTRWRGDDAGKNVSPWIKKAISKEYAANGKISTFALGSLYAERVKQILIEKELPFTDLGSFHYVNNGAERGRGSPMVLLAFHLSEKSNLPTLRHLAKVAPSVDLPKTSRLARVLHSFPLHLSPMKNKNTSAHEGASEISIRRNMARALVKTGQFRNTDIDRALGLPPVTAAGFAAAAKRYGKEVLTKTVEV